MAKDKSKEKEPVKAEEKKDTGIVTISDVLAAQKAGEAEKKSKKKKSKKKKS